MVRKQVCCALPDEVLKKFKQIDNETGVPISRQIEMKLRGYSIVKENENDFNSDMKSYDVIDVTDDNAKYIIINYIKSKISISELAENLHLDLEQISNIISELFNGDK